MIIIRPFLYLFFFIFSSLSVTFSEEAKNDGGLNLIKDIFPFNDDGTINAVIEINAGSNEKWEVSDSGDKIIHTLKGNRKRMIEYLPYPYNYGFVPQTIVPLNENGDGDPLDIIVIGPSIEKGSVVKVKPIATMIMKDANELDSKVIAISINNLNLSYVNSLEDLEKNYVGLFEIVKLWTINYKGIALKLERILGKKSTKKYIEIHHNYFLN